MFCQFLLFLILNSSWGANVETATHLLGVNLEGNADWSRSKMFVDAMKSARPFGSPDKPWDEVVPVGPDGWPTQDFGVVIFSGQVAAGGTYSLSFDGRADVSPVASNAVVKGLSYNSKKNHTQAKIQVSPEADQLILSFKKTKGRVKNLRLTRPGYSTNSKSVFTNEWLATLKPFSTLRLMDLLRTNGNETKFWSERPLVLEPTQATSKGIAIEYAVEMANLTQKDIWLNIPALADDDYVENLARLLKNSLNNESKIYLEYSNEIWNSGFKANRQNHEAAEKECFSGPTTLNEKGRDQNHHHWAWRRVARRLIEIRDLFEKEFGPDPSFLKVRPILATQVAYPEILKVALEFLVKIQREPSKTLYGVAGAPYFNIGRKAEAIPEASKKLILTWLSEDLTRTIDEYFVPNNLWGGKDVDYNVPTLAHKYDLRYIAYEGGPDTAGKEALEGKMEAHQDPKMGELIKKQLSKWFACNGNLFVYYSLSGGQGQYGSWGLYENISKLTPKAKAVIEIANTELNQLKKSGCP